MGQFLTPASVATFMAGMIGPAFVAYSQSVTGGGRLYTSIGSFLP